MRSNSTIPPRLPQRILLRFLRDDLAEEVLGDLDEKFYSTVKNKSALRAKLNYWYQVVHYMRPFAIRRSRSTASNHFTMFQNYFKIGWRNLLRNKGYSFINIGGLATGMAVTMLIGLWIYDEVSFDKYHEHYGRIAQVLQHQTFNGVKGTESSIPRPLEMALRNEYGSDFQYLSMATWTGDNILSAGEQKITASGNFFQADFPEMLSLKMLKGTRGGLKDPSSILLSASTAKALFGDGDPMNQPVRIGGLMDAIVEGVYEDLPYNTSFNGLGFMASWELFVNSEPWVKRALDQNQWGNNSFQLFAMMAPGADMNQVSEKIKNIKAKSDKGEAAFKPEIFLSPMHNWHLRSEWKEGKNIGGRIQQVWLFGIIGLFVLLLACINFMNLSTARSEKRGKEVGIRMTIGSVRGQLINQFLSESFLVVVLAFVVAIGLVVICLPWFNDLADKRMTIAWSTPVFWIISIAFILFTSLLAGSYPALYLSSFRPVNVLKGTFRAGRFASIPRKVLVVIQFTVSVTLIIGTIIVHQQIQFTKSRPIGYDRDGLIMIPIQSPEFHGKFDVLRTELKNSGAVEEMSESSSPLTDIWSNQGGFDWKGRNPDLHPEFATIWVSPEHGKTVNWKIKEGRDISRELLTDSSAVILNEAAVKFMNVKDPVGMEIKWHNATMHVVGVIKDMITISPYSPVKQTVYIVSYGDLNWINLRLSPGKPVAESLARIEAVFKKHTPSVPFDYRFVDKEYAKKFATEERIGVLASVFAVLAIFISCLGISGLAAFVAEQRTKEIGIRKVLGATVINLWRMLSKDFVVLVMIACVIAIPVAWYLLLNWLQQYEYHTDISWWIPALTGLGALLITLITVSYQAVKAALMNPVKSLRSE